MSSGYQPFAAKGAGLLKSIIYDEIKYPIYFGHLTLSILRGSLCTLLLIKTIITTLYLFFFYFKGLLKKNPTKRLGCSEDDSKIRRHRFFKQLDWEALELRQIQPPFIPSIVSINILELNSIFF